MMTNLEKRKLLYKIAKAYYEDELTQNEIGKRFGLSRVKISRLLQQARSEQIVQITIIPPQQTQADLERQLETQFNLDEAVIISPTAYNAATISAELGTAAAECLIRSLQGNEVLGLSWGKTLLAVVDALPAQDWPDMRVVQILGGLGRPEAETHGTELTQRVARTFGAKMRVIPAPGIVPTKLVHDALMSDPQIVDTLNLAASADVALVGIGRPTSDSVVMQAGILTEDEFNKLETQGAVGDIALRFFDGEGQILQHEIRDRIMGLDLEQIKAIPRVIGVAGGADKYAVIKAALQGNFINVLVTDDKTAHHLLGNEENPIPASAESVATAI